MGIVMKKIGILIFTIVLSGCSLRVRNYNEEQYLQKYNETLNNYDKTLGNYIEKKDIEKLEKQFEFLKVQLKSDQLPENFKKEYNIKINNYLNIMEDLKD